MRTLTFTAVATGAHEIWRDDGATGFNFDLLTTLAGGVASYDDATGTALHSYKVRAVSDGDPSDFDTADAAEPDPPTDLDATGAGPMTVTWTAADATVYHELQRDDGDGFLTIAFIEPGTETFEDADGDEDSSYQLRAVRASQASDFVVFVPLDPPAAPSGLTVTVDPGIENLLEWTDNADDPDNEEDFEILRNLDRGSFDTLTVTDPDDESYSDDVMATPGTRNAYRVRARNAAGNSAWLDHVASKPTGLTVAAFPATPNRTPTWALGGGNENICTGIQVWRNVNGAGYVLIATTGPNVVEYEDTDDLTADIGNACAYKVREVNSVGNSAFSNEASGTIIA